MPTEGEIREAPPSSRPTERSVSESAAIRILSEITPPITRNVTDFNGELCRIQPLPGQVPIQTGLTPKDGCGLSSPGAVLEFNTAALYADAMRHTVRIDLERSTPEDRNRIGQGSGVIIGRTDDKCVVLTNNHVVETDEYEKSRRTSPGGPSPTTSAGASRFESLSVVLADGSRFPATVLHAEPSRDTAIVALPTGSRTAELCAPARFGKPAEAGTSGTYFGYPSSTVSLYGSPVEIVASTSPTRSMVRHGMDPSMTLTMTRGTTIGGNSGGPLIADDGRVTGILYGGPGPIDYAIPISPEYVERMMARVRTGSDPR